jgi:hypothetical protein
MPTVPRLPKAAGSVSYQGEVARGVPDIIDVELDNDIQPLYDLVNGNLDNANLAANANIAYSKVNLAGQVRPSDLAPGFTLPAGSVSTTQIADASVTMAKMALFASCVAGTPAQADRTDTVALDMGANDQPGAESTIQSVAWTTRGGPFFLFAELMLEMVCNGNTPSSFGAVMRLRWDTGVGNPALGTLFFQRAARCFVAPGTVGPLAAPIAPLSFATPFFGSYLFGGAGVAHRVSQTIQITVGSLARPLAVNHTNSSIVLVETA